MNRGREICFALDHPAAAGHFPGNPIVPGALLLDEAVRLIGEDSAVVIRSAKFFRPVRPGERLRLDQRSAPGGVVRFEYRLAANDALVASGVLETGVA